MTAKWQEYADASGRAYWYNSETRESVWEKPDELKTPEEKLLSKTYWKEFVAQNGKKYWYHSQTKQSTWEMPEEIRRLLQQTQKLTREHLDSISAKSDPVPAPSAPSVWSDSTTQQYMDFHFHTKEEAEAAFLDFLKSVGVQSDWTWDEAMRKLIHYPMYKALKSARERKEAFESYVEQLKQKEREEERNQNIRARREFRHLLEKNSHLFTSVSKLSKAERLLGTDSAWVALKNERERKDIFDSVIYDIKRKEKEKERDQKYFAKRKFDSWLSDHKKISETSFWQDVWQLFQTECGNDPDVKYLDPLDALICFENYIKYHERKNSDQQRKEKEEKTKKERQNRNAFRDLLNELKHENKININTKWKEIYPLIKNDERYLNMFGQLGSTPLDLFRDVIVDLEDQYYSLYHNFKYLLRELEPRVQLYEPWEKIQERVKGRSAYEAIQDPDLAQEFYNKFKRRLEEKEKRSRSRHSSRKRHHSSSREEKEDEKKPKLVEQQPEEEEKEEGEFSAVE